MSTTKLTTFRTITNYSPKQDRGSDGRWVPSGSKSATQYDGLTPNEFHKKITKDYGNQAKWTEEQQEAVARYCGFSFTTYNQNLINVQGDVSKLNTLDREDIELLDSTMKNKLKTDTTLYRGIALDTLYEVGDTIEEYNYGSSSFFKSKGEQFAKSEAHFHPSAYPYLLKINAKKGQKGVIPTLADQTQYRTGLRTNEAEFLLPRNNTYKINKIIDRGDYEELEVDIL